MIEWAIAEYKKHMSMTADLVVLLDRERTEIERMKGVINRLHDALGRQQGQITRLQFSKDYFENETMRLRAEVEKSKIPFPGPKTSSEVYAAQNELELLRNIRHSQGEGITRLRQQLTEACKMREELLRRIEHDATVVKRLSDEKDYLAQAVEMLQRDDRHIAASELRELRVALDAEIASGREAKQERDAASHRANAWREGYNRVEQERDAARERLAQVRAECDSASRRTNAWRKAYNDVVIRLRKARKLFVALRDERDVAREGLGQARSAVQALYQETDRLRKDLKVSQAVNHIISRREQHNPRLEMILEESYRNEFKRNIDNQKATDAPNCPSS